MKAAIEKAVEDLKTLLLNHEEEISTAYLSGDEDLGVQINVGIKIEPAPISGAHNVTTKINFVESRVKDEISGLADRDQLKLGLAEAV